MQLFICYFFFIFAVFRAENSSTSSPISIVPDWVLLSGCGPCRYCLALQGYEEPFFCITEVTEIPCYIRAQYYPEWTDGCSFANAQGGVALPVDEGVLLATIEDPIPECEPRIEPCRCHEHMCRKAAMWFPEGNLASMMVYVIPNWRGSEKFGIDFKNLRLKVIPKVEVELLHLPTWPTFRTQFQLSEKNATTCVNFYKRHDRTMSIEQLYFVEFGIILEYPELPLVFLHDSGKSELNGQLFPQEVINIVPLEY